MKEQWKDFRQLLCRVYIFLLMVVLPLYAPKGYWGLGDQKYLLFRNVTILCLLGFLSALCPGGSIGCREPLRKMSFMDICMLLYGTAVCVSAVCSSFGTNAWLGYRDWYMGALSQLLFVGVYFLAADSYIYRTYDALCGGAAVLAVVTIGFLQRISVDIFGFLHTYNAGDWEYSHMLSTIGNINWFAGYLIMMLPLFLTAYFHGNQKCSVYFNYVVTVCVMTMLLLNGSGSGVLGGGISVLFSLGTLFFRPEWAKRWLSLCMGVSLAVPVYGILVNKTNSVRCFPEDGCSRSLLQWRGWWLLAGVFLVAVLIVKKLPQREAKVWTKRLVAAIFAIGFAVMAGGIVFVMLRPHLITSYIWQKDWGNGRGILMRMALSGFMDGDIKDKLIGAGPDCFAMAVTKNPVMNEGHWRDAVFANAHNEWCNQLVNIGLIGLGLYISLFVTGLLRYRKSFLGVLTIILYAAYATFGFQQVMCTPYLFLILGMCESATVKQRRCSLQMARADLLCEGNKMDEKILTNEFLSDRQ